MCSGVPLWLATEMAFWRSSVTGPSTSATPLIISGFIMLRP
jgi:hypothetical protein